MGGKPGLGGRFCGVQRPGSLGLQQLRHGRRFTLGNGNGQFGRSRIHTDDSIEVKYYDGRRTFSTRWHSRLRETWDASMAAREQALAPGQTIINNVNCFHDTPTSHKQTFAGWMAYNRFWFKKDTYGVTVGGGAMNNPGRYLTLLPPCQRRRCHQWLTVFHTEPRRSLQGLGHLTHFRLDAKEYITFRTEYGYRHANVPSFPVAVG